MLEFLFESSIAMSLFLQSLGEGVLKVFEYISLLGTEDFYFLVMPGLFWSVDAVLGLRVGVVLMYTVTANTLLKWAFHLPRPYWIDTRVRGLVAESTFGAPSGHSQFNASIYGLIAHALRRRWVWVLAIVLVFLISFSRIVLGVHFYLDVLLGWAFGILVLWSFLRWEKPVLEWLKGRSLQANIILLLVFSIVLLAFGAGILGFQERIGIPEEWVSNALLSQPEEVIDPLKLDDLITSVGTFFGFAAAALWLYGRGGYSAAGPNWQRGLRFVIGMLGVLVLWQGLGIIFPRNADLISYMLRFVRYALVGLWIAGGAPWLFLRFGLAKPSE
ncbi:MAG: phosphatase PAP2 family protein [Chloroflexi bacterium]|nr:phosphatase PAP2 family protein [Chloroflexota bacterium]